MGQALLLERACFACSGMKRFFLLFWQWSLGCAQAETIFLPGVSKESGWTDYNKSLAVQGDDNQNGYPDAGLFYAALSGKPVSLTFPGEDNTSVTGEYYQLVSEHGWYSGNGSKTMYLNSFEIFDVTQSDTWGLQHIPEASTVALGVLALVGLAVRRRRQGFAA